MNVVRDLRQRAGLTQALFAQISGVSQKSISRYEVGKRSPTLDVLSRLAASVDLAVEVNIVPNHGDRAAATDPAPLSENHQPQDEFWTI